MLKATRLDGPQQAERQQPIRRDGDRFAVKAGQRRDPAQLGDGFKQRHGLRDAARIGRQAAEARQRGIDDRARRESCDRVHIAGAARHAVPGQRAQQFCNIKRRSSGHDMTGRAERLVDLLAEGRAGQLVDAGPTQARGLDALQPLRRAQLVEQRVGGARLDAFARRAAARRADPRSAARDRPASSPTPGRSNAGHR